MNYEILLQIPGRIRIKIDNLYKNQKLADMFNSLSVGNSICSIQPNIYTSNALILYNYEKSNLQDIINYIKNSVDNIDQKNDLGRLNEFNNTNMVQINLTTNEIRKNLILKYNIFKKNALKISKIKHLKKILVGLGFVSLLSYKINLVLLLIAIYYFNKFINSILSSLYINKINYYTNYKITRNELLINQVENTEETPLSEALYSIEIIVMLLGLMIFYLTGNSNILISSLVLTQMNLLPLINSLTYLSAYFKLKKNSIFINNQSKFQKNNTFDTMLILTDNGKCINESLIEDLREKGILDIQIISKNESLYLNEIESNFGLNIIYCKSMEKALMNEISRLKIQNRKIIVVSMTDNLFIHKKIAEDIDLNILIAGNIDYKCKRYDIVMLNNYHLLGETIDYIKYIHEKVTQNQLLLFWIYVYCNILIFGKNIAPLYVLLIALLNKVLVYFSSLKPLKYTQI